jgi:hypothetical protein
VIAARYDFYLLFFTSAANTVNYPVVASDPPRPPAGEITAQWFWLAEPFERAAPNIPQKGVNPPDNLTIIFPPVEIIFPGILGP